MQMTNLTEKRLELAVMDRLRHVMEPAVRLALMDVLHGGRRTQNGVTEPAPGKIRNIWDTLDQQENPARLTLAQAVAACKDNEGFNTNCTRIQYYRWRQFNGYADAN